MWHHTVATGECPSSVSRPSAVLGQELGQALGAQLLADI